MVETWAKASGLGKRGYQFRWPTGIVAAILLIVHHSENQIAFTWVDYVILITVLVLPHVYFLRYVRAGNDKGVAFNQIRNDLLLAGLIAGSIELSAIPSIIYTLVITTTYVSARGFSKLYRVGLIPLGMFLASWLQGFHFHFQSSNTINIISLVFGVTYFLILSYVSYIYAKHQYEGKKLIAEQKKEIDEKANEILVQAEELQTLNESLKSLNENLEMKIEERTEDLKVQNAKLSHYAFINAHQLRAPVASILGLIQLFTYHKNQSREEQEIISRLKTAASELDHIVHEIKNNLEKENLIDPSAGSERFK